MSKKFSHIDSKGKTRMVDVSSKPVTLRTAEAYAKIIVSKELFGKIKSNEIKKGDVLSTAKIAGIQAAKKTSEFIPLCHNIFISLLEINFVLLPKENAIEIFSFVKTESQTGVEMEALTSVTISALTIYDMCKAVDKSITIKDIHLISKTGGKSKDYYKVQ